MKATLHISETLKYTRQIEVELPEDMSEEELEELLEDADRENFWGAEEYVEYLESHGVKTFESVDSSLDSPDDVEVECEHYETTDKPSVRDGKQ